MTAFEFRLASVLKLRESVRDQRCLELAETLQADAQLQRQLDAIRGELALVQSGRPRTPVTGAWAFDQLRDFDRYATRLRREEQSLLHQRHDLAKEIGDRRAALVEADADVRILEKLRDAGLSRYREELSRHESRQLDEVASRQNAPEDVL